MREELKKAGGAKAVKGVVIYSLPEMQEWHRVMVQDLPSSGSNAYSLSDAEQAYAAVLESSPETTNRLAAEYLKVALLANSRPAANFELYRRHVLEFHEAQHALDIRDTSWQTTNTATPFIAMPTLLSIAQCKAVGLANSVAGEARAFVSQLLDPSIRGFRLYQVLKPVIFRTLVGANNSPDYLASGHGAAGDIVRTALVQELLENPSDYGITLTSEDSRANGIKAMLTLPAIFNEERLPATLVPRVQRRVNTIIRELLNRSTTVTE